MERLLTVQEAAHLLGIKPQTLYLWVAMKRIAHHKVGRLVRFTEADLSDFVERQRQLPVGLNDEPL